MAWRTSPMSSRSDARMLALRCTPSLRSRLPPRRRMLPVCWRWQCWAKVLRAAEGHCRRPMEYLAARQCLHRDEEVMPPTSLYKVIRSHSEYCSYDTSEPPDRRLAMERWTTIVRSWDGGRRTEHHRVRQHLPLHRLPRMVHLQCRLSGATDGARKVHLDALGRVEQVQSWRPADWKQLCIANVSRVFSFLSFCWNYSRKTLRKAYCYF